MRYNSAYVQKLVKTCFHDNITIWILYLPDNYFQRVLTVTPGKHKNVVTSKIPLVLNIFLGRKRCSCEQIDNITAYFVRTNNSLVGWITYCAILRISAYLWHQLFTYRTRPYTPNRPFAARHSRGTKLLESKSRTDKQKTYMSCHSATFALQRGCFVLRE